MALQLTLKPYERIVINGCVVRNASRKSTLVIETKADVVRGHDLLSKKAAVTPVNQAYFLVQSALTDPGMQDKLRKPIQKQLAALATTFGPPNVHYVFEAANHVSNGDYYKALRALRPLMKREAEILGVHLPRPDSIREEMIREAQADESVSEAAVRRVTG
ncbi:flagellar biosynthesis repressor FlbT [Pseudooceanicola sp. C21-150M6]|uniref:flagellar biosynthesis repressor FlbT n=1 Tax=Pseudooceanicola sp. C21-150M6 TaxID=3434355 RepID=UPI003D7FC369